MSRSISFAWVLSVAIAALVFSACAGSAALSREDAISALQTTGVTEAEATCMADTLQALGRLDVADPRRDRTADAREALISASSRCVGATKMSAVVAGAQISQQTPTDPEPSRSAVSGGLDFSELSATGDDDRRVAAIERLELLGRSAENATCIVDHLIDVVADGIFESPNFGVGLDPFEAQAFALCAAADS